MCRIEVFFLTLIYYLFKLTGMELKEFRTLKGLSQSDVAKAIGKTVAYVSLMERGLRSPSLKTAGLIKDFSGGAVTYEDQSKE